MTGGYRAGYYAPSPQRFAPWQALLTREDCNPSSPRQVECIYEVFYFYEETHHMIAILTNWAR